MRRLLKSIANYAKATDSYDVRRYLAIFCMAGGSIAMTLLVLLCIILIGNAHPGLLFWIALGAMILIGLQQTGFIALLAKRSIEISRDSIRVTDEEEVTESVKEHKT